MLGNTIFEEEYQYHRSLGKSHIEAYHRAVDYYRKFTRREITSGWEEYSETFEQKIHTEASQIIHVNETFSKLFPKVKEVSDKAGKLLCLIFRFEGLEQFLNEENIKIIYEEVGDDYPEAVWEMAKMLGYKTKGSSSSRIHVLKSCISRIANEMQLGLKL